MDVDGSYPPTTSSLEARQSQPLLPYLSDRAQEPVGYTIIESQQ